MNRNLKKKGITATRIVTEENDVPLNTRVSRVNTICREFGAQNCCVVSIHLDAVGSDGKWHSARGTDYDGQIFYPDATRNQDNYTRDHLDMLSVDKELGVFKIMRIGVNTDLQMRPKNFLTYDYVNHRIVSNS